MLTRNKQKSDCVTDADLVALLYGEMAEAERVPVEEHLSDCSMCVEEFATISEARLGMYEWNRDELARLATPVIQIPYGESVRAGFLERVYTGFAIFTQFGTAAAACGIAVVAIVGGYFLMRTPTETNTAETRTQPAIVQPEGQPKREESVPAAVMPTGGEIASESKPRAISTVSAVRKVRNVSMPKSELAAVKKQNSGIKRESLVAQQQTAPRLTSNAELNDNSLRLADLFSELDANE